MRRLVSDLTLGVRLSVGGGRSGWVRLALIAVGVGLGVTMLLVAASIPTVLDGRADRADARSVNTEQTLTRGSATLLTEEVRSEFRDQGINGRMLQPEADTAPLPPGVARHLAPGEVLLSPALARLVESPDGASLRGRWGEHVVGTIGDEGLAGPGELTFYLGTDQLTDDGGATRIEAFGGAETYEEDVSIAILLLALVGMVVLLFPVAIFVSTAVRFGSESRDRRLAALRLAGADVGTTRRIAAGETLAGAVLGLALGSLLYLVVGQVAGYVVPANMSFYPGDFRPLPALAALVMVLVPVTTVLVTLSALRKVLVEPLGVVRRSSQRRRRFWWRLVFPVLGIALLYPLVLGMDDSTGNQIMVVAGLVFLLAGVALILPWLVEAVVHRLGRGGVAWDLAVRRLQLDSGTEVRAVSGIAVSVAGLIALQGLVGAIESSTDAWQGDTSTFQASVLVYEPTADAGEVWPSELAQARGVEEVEVLTSVWATAPGASAASAIEDESFISWGTCEVLAQEAHLDSCADGDVFVVLPDGATAPAAGSTYVLDGDDDGVDESTRWTLPASAEAVAPAPGVSALGGGPAQILVTPGAMGGIDPEPESLTAYAVLDPAVPDAVEHLRTTAGHLDPRASASLIAISNTALRDIRQALSIGTVALLLLIGASVLVNVVEQLRERRQLLAVLVAFGTRRRTLGGSVLFQIAIPVVLGVALAVATGTALALTLAAVVDAPLTVDWLGVGTTSGAAALVVLLTTAAGLPLLWQLTRPGGLRSE